MTTPRQVTITPRLALWGICLVVAVVFATRRDDDAELQRAEDNGYRAAKRSAVTRRENAERLRAYEAAQLATDAKFADAKRRMSAASTRLADVYDQPPVLDTAPRRWVIGPVLDTDTLVPLRLARLQIAEYVEEANTVFANIEAAVNLERGRAAVAIVGLQTLVAQQDTVIAGLRSALGRARKPWPVRAVRGVEHAAAGVACGTLGYIALGPLGGIGTGVLCAAISGVVR